MEVLWLATELNAQEKHTEDWVNGILSIFFTMAEIWCIISTAKTFTNRLLRYQISLTVFYISLHLMLIMRVFYLLKHWLIEYPTYLERAVDNGTVIAKDIFCLALTCRILEAVHAEDTAIEYIPKLIKVIYGFAAVHAAVFVGLYLAYCTYEIELSYLAIYCAIIQFLIALIYIFVCSKFLALWKSIATEEESKYLKWLLVIVIYVGFVLLIRVLVNIGEFVNLQEYLEDHDFTMLMIYRVAVLVITELIPCTLMSWYLFNLGTEFRSLLNPLDSVVKGQL
eukprot:TRINITY_DN5012_c3_g1_i1.p1 TRINITY_DN5012_c3_g1~~TRINITY_DN5012_c3_g1_i1.p1  ORF type:complete len:281 (+),score=26.36 TRINITY_DN5012_c3_g1_i1:83-925(+)